MTTPVDPKSLHGKLPRPRDHAEILVVGAGPAGTAAAIEASRHGARVVLVDENPVSAELIGLDVPLFYGGRAGAAVQTKERLLERMVDANPRLEEAFEAGVEVALGTCAWGVFLNGPGLQTLPVPAVGLADDADAWMCGFDRLIVATGARDLVLFFDGADQPGVMGAQALHALLTRYQAFDGRELVILGSDELAAATAELALAHGLNVAALVEVAGAPRTAAGRIAALGARGVPVLTGHTILRAERGPYGVSAAVLVGPGGTERRIACDTICLAIDRVPVVDLLDTAGAALLYDEGRGGHVPRVTAANATSLPSVFVAGDCAGLVPGSVGDTAHAEADGRAAALAALRSLGRTVPEAPADTAPLSGAGSLSHRLEWMRALLDTGGMDVLACQCETVSRGDLLGVRPPRYLGAGPSQRRDLATLLGDGPVNQDQVKRLTRACMGPCQARRCREQVAMTLALAAGVEVGRVPLAGHRAPLRPLPLALLARLEELPAMREEWDVWFGIPTQWVPYDDIGTEREAAFLGGNLHL